MILVDGVICKECKNYKMIAKAGEEESSEYIKCAVAKSGNAEELLKWKGTESECSKFEKEDDDGEDSKLDTD